MPASMAVSVVHRHHAARLNASVVVTDAEGMPLPVGQALRKRLRQGISTEL